jgi:coenzyme F420-0:L-glutamate ligase / coenzyme F420-1:gamma-L-glutamate ligase
MSDDIGSIAVLPIRGVPEIGRDEDLAQVFDEHNEHGWEDGDVLVVAQKVVSKTEGRVVDSADKRAVAESESARILRRAGDMVISETKHGFVCANAGVDASNTFAGTITLLPLDPDLSARRLRTRLGHLVGVDIGVIISDTFGRAWRLGQTNVAIGVAGIDAFSDYRGTSDMHGNDLSATRICTADELAGAAELVMRKTTGICAVIVRGAQVTRSAGSARSIVRPPQEDFFR